MTCEYYKNCPEYDSKLDKCRDFSLPCKRYEERISRFQEYRGIKHDGGARNNQRMKKTIENKTFDLNLNVFKKRQK